MTYQGYGGGSVCLPGFETLTARPTHSTAMTDDAVDPDEVRHVASLARVDLDDEAVERFASQFVDILDAFESLDEVPEVDHEADLANVMRTDEVEDSLDQDEALANAPETEAGFFKGPKVS